MGIKYRLTDSDFKILEFIGRFRYVLKSHMENYAQVNAGGLNSRIQKFRALELLESCGVLQNVPGLYKLSKTAISMFAGRFRYVEKVSLATFYHDMKVLDLFVDLFKQNGTSDFLTDRELKIVDWGYDYKNVRPDFVLFSKSNEKQKVAYEVELTKKNKARIESLWVDYIGSGYTKIYYFVVPEIFEYYNKIFIDGNYKNYKIQLEKL